MSYDVAHEKWGDKWQMPSSEQINELINNCTSKWKTLNSLKGRYYTGPNGNTIFLPAAGYRWGGNLYRINGNGYYWSSSQGPSQSDYAYLLNVSSKSSLLDVLPLQRPHDSTSVVWGVKFIIKFPIFLSFSWHTHPAIKVRFWGQYRLMRARAPELPILFSATG